MLGHRHIATTQRYARVSNEKITRDMKELSMNITNIFPSIDNYKPNI
jgi:hypothetical protein